MPTAAQVTPGAWTDILILYDDGQYSAIWGRFRKRPARCLGVRWNGNADEPQGFPNARGYPQWHVEPSFLTVAVLTGLLEELASATKTADTDRYNANILEALREVTMQLAAGWR